MARSAKEIHRRQSTVDGAKKNNNSDSDGRFRPIDPLCWLLAPANSLLSLLDRAMESRELQDKSTASTLLGCNSIQGATSACVTN